MTFMKHFSIPTPKSITAVGGIVVGDTTSPCAKFIDRFGTAWRLIPELKNVYVICDKLGKVCFTLRDGEIGVWAMSKEKFMQSIKTDTVDIYAELYCPVDPTYKYHYLQLLKLMQEQGIE